MQLQPAVPQLVTAAQLTQAAVLQLLVVQLLTHHAVLQPATAVATAATPTQAAVLQLVTAVATAATPTQPVLLQLHVVTVAETAVAKAAAMMTAAKLRS